MNKLGVLPILLLFFASGCATTEPDMYDWGPYEDTLFAVYHEPAHKEEALKNYMTFIRDRDGNVQIAPGLFAEAGTFLLNQGDISGAIRFYKLEYETWPESRPMLGTLIDNLEAER